MVLSGSLTRARAATVATLLAAGLAGCGSSVSTSSFKGEEHAVAETIANLQADATAGEQGKLCKNDLSAAVVSRLGGTAGCQAAVKSQLSEIDNLEASVESVKISSTGKTATAQVKSVNEGKQAIRTVSLVHEDGRWKVDSLS
jgi:hypothetical protein